MFFFIKIIGPGVIYADFFLQYQQKWLSGRDSPAKASLERSDSGCSISSGGGGNSKPELPDRNYRNDRIYQNQSDQNTCKYNFGKNTILFKI